MSARDTDVQPAVRPRWHDSGDAAALLLLFVRSFCWSARPSLWPMTDYRIMLRLGEPIPFSVYHCPPNGPQWASQLQSPPSARLSGGP